MSSSRNYALRLPVSLYRELQEVAKNDGTTMNQFITIAVAEKLAALLTEEFFRKRAGKADLTAFERVLAKAGSEPPQEGDELP